MSPLVHVGASPWGGTLTYRRHGARAVVSTSLVIDGVPARSGPGFEYQRDDGEVEHTWPSTWITVRAPTGWGIDLVEGDELDVVVGGVFDARIEVLSWSYAVTWTTGYSGAFTVGPWVAARWRPDTRWTVEGALAAPLVGWVSRSPYALNDDQYIRANQSHNGFVSFGAYVADGRVAWVGDYQALRPQIGAAYDVSRVTSVVASYRFELLHDTQPLPVLAYGHALELGVRVSW